MVPIAVLLIWHIVAIPIGFLYLIGKPVVMTLAPLVPSAESRAFRRQLCGRPALSSEEFRGTCRSWRGHVFLKVYIVSA
jgi:hypothetical protein